MSVPPEIALEADLELSAAIAALDDETKSTYHLFNPYHDSRGRFSVGRGARDSGAISVGGGSVSTAMAPVDTSGVLTRMQEGKVIDDVSLDDLGPVTAAMADDPGHIYNLNQVKPTDNPTIFEGLGMPRGADPSQGWRGMPQLADDEVVDWIGELRARGVNVRENTLDEPRRYRASQSQLNGGKTGSIARKGAYKNNTPILATSDGWIIDGHHRFTAAIAAHDSAPFTIIDMPIMDALRSSQDFLDARRGAGTWAAGM